MSRKIELPEKDAEGQEIKWFGLADGNSFYCSCEVSQKPWFEDRAVIVASNSDKIAIALNRKAKSLGFKMGDLLFEKTKEIREHRVLVWPSNYELYGKKSGMMHTALATFVQDIQVESIDEAWLDFTGYEHLDLFEYGQEIINTIRYGQWLPIALGIAQTKTLAKAANKLAKKAESDKKGFYLIATEEDRIEALKKTPLEDVWGIGRQYYKTIAREVGRSEGLTAWDFTQLHQKRVKKLLYLPGERTYMELKGIRCYDFEDGPDPKERIMTSRMMTPPETEYADVRATLAQHLHTGVGKLRQQGSYARKMFVFFMTSQHENYRRPKITLCREIRFPSPLDTVPEMLPYLDTLCTALWPDYRDDQEKFRFNKCGVMLGEISPNNAKQPYFGEDIERSRKMQAFQAAVDEINGNAPADKRMGVFAVEMSGTKKKKFKREGLSENPVAVWKERHRIKNS